VSSDGTAATLRQSLERAVPRADDLSDAQRVDVLDHQEQCGRAEYRRSDDRDSNSRGHVQSRSLVFPW
jgi:hypothetical protein